METSNCKLMSSLTNLNRTCHVSPDPLTLMSA
jgi:hypothetical protein